MTKGFPQEVVARFPQPGRRRGVIWTLILECGHNVQRAHAAARAHRCDCTECFRLAFPEEADTLCTAPRDQDARQVRTLLLKTRMQRDLDILRSGGSRSFQLAFRTTS